MKRIFIHLVFLACSVFVAYIALVAVGEGEEYFGRRSSPTTVFILSLFITAWLGFDLISNLSKRFLPSSSTLLKTTAEYLRLSKGQEPYLHSIGYIAMGGLLIIFSAPFMGDSRMQTNQYLELGFLLVLGVFSILWGGVKAFMAFLRLPEDD